MTSPALHLSLAGHDAPLGGMNKDSPPKVLP